VSSEQVGFAHANQAVQVERTVTHKKTGEATTGSRQFIASIEHHPGHAAAMQTGGIVRHHWRVENNIHWLRDAVCGEDTCRSRDPNSACALALLRTALLADVRASGRESLTEAIENFAADRKLAVALIRNQRLTEPPA
jgi:predicted transposase YbfD/YdcC